MEINEAIQEICAGSFKARAMIIYNETKAVLMMPVGASSDGKKYKIWDDFSSVEEAKGIALDWGKHMNSVDIRTKEIDDIPEDPEVLLCNQFLLSFC